MKPILSAEEMRKCDLATIEHHHIPSLVLMERAAKVVTNYILNNFDSDASICVICGPGNNGGDGVAIGRMLHLAGRKASLIVLGNKDKFSEQLSSEIEIANSYGVALVFSLEEKLVSSADIVVDAMFGIGLTRGLAGEYLEAAKLVNSLEKDVVAVDIPSGYDSDSGKLLGEEGVKADVTITFAYMKKGLILGECKEAAGKVQVADVGIYLDEKTDCLLVDEEILNMLPKRKVTANKGDCGKILVVAGSENIYGACYLSAKAAIVAGSGLVKIYTHKNNIVSIQQALPETMYFGYEEFDKEELLKSMDWADVILIGPGLGTSETAKAITKTVLENTKVPVVVDADGLNICAENLSLLTACASKNPVVITPHLKEMERLSGKPVKELNYAMEENAREFSLENNVTTVLKNHTTVIASQGKIFYCNSGNEALATPGAGDVLAGIIASLIGQGTELKYAAAAGAFLQGTSGKKNSKEYGAKAVLARDIIDKINS